MLQFMKLFILKMYGKQVNKGYIYTISIGLK